MAKYISIKDLKEELSHYDDDDHVVIDVWYGEDFDSTLNDVSTDAFDCLDAETRNELSTKLMQAVVAKPSPAHGVCWRMITLHARNVWRDYLAETEKQKAAQPTVTKSNKFAIYIASVITALLILIGIALHICKSTPEESLLVTIREQEDAGIIDLKIKE